MSKKTNRQLLIFGALSLLFFIIGLQIERYAHREPDTIAYVRQLEEKLNETELEINTVFSNASFLMSAISGELGKDSIEHYNAKKYTLLIFNEEDSLLYWSNNDVFPLRSDAGYSEDIVRQMTETGGSQYYFIKYPYELVINKVRKRYSLIALVPIYMRFPISNGYLKNYFPLMPPEYSDYVMPTKEDTWPVLKDMSGTELIRLKPLAQIPYRSFIIWGFIAYAFFGFFLILVFYIISSIVLRKSGVVAGLATFIGLILTLRLVTIYSEFPIAAQMLDLFQLRFSVSNRLWFYSLGDFLLDISIFLWATIFIVHKWEPRYILRWSSFKQWFFAIFVYMVLIGGFHFLQLVLSDIVLNNSIYFEFEDFSKLDIYSFYALIGVVLLVLSYFLLTNKLFRLLMPFDLPLKVHASIGGACLLISIGFGAFFHYSIWTIISTIFFSTLLTILLMAFSKHQKLSFIWLSGWLLFFAAATTFVLEEANVEKLINMRKDFLKKVVFEQDPKVEEMIVEMEGKLQDDNFLKLYFNSLLFSYNQTVERLTYHYLDNAFFGRYKYNVYFYNAMGIPKRPDFMSYADVEYVMGHGEKTASKHLFFLSDPFGRYRYFVHLPVKENNNLLGTLVIELIPKELPDESSIYVELLSLPKGRLEKTFEEMEFAFYKNNQRIFGKKGNFPALLSLEGPLPEQNQFKIVKEDGTRSMIYRDERDYVAITTLPEESFLKPLSIFSYLFCSGIITVIIMFMLFWLFNKIFQRSVAIFLFKISLRERIQQGIVTVSLLSFVAIGVITIFYFQDEYTEYHRSRLERKIETTAKTAIWQIINSVDSIAVIPDARELAAIVKIDVNIYDINGAMLSTSEEAVFERRLLSRQMHPVAYHKMKFEQLNKFTQSERINNFEYLSSYVPLKKRNGEIVAFLNLPYDLVGSNNIRSRDVAEFLGALLNVYVIFLLIAGIVAFLLANSVTRPLAVIGEKLRLIKIGGRNEKIDWNSKDEIGEFVERFNIMIEELDNSTRELARTQRETAWREMARQVAHEIKNPLTPMKLQIQMLERAADKDMEKARTMLKKATKSLIQQIDNLAHIASEFSNFAKMPTAINKDIEINQLVESVFTLFKEEENIQLRLNMCPELLVVFADENQILRVFNNLVKNAIQAIPFDQPGIINISLYHDKGMAVVKVSDNGCGIPEAKKEDIFTPYFTTKSSGTGIGLAMSKSIIEAAKGTLTFTSKENVGTDFYVSLPMVQR